MDYLLNLLIVYVILFFVSLFISNQRFTSPNVVFCTSFLIMLILAYSYKIILGFQLSEKTFEIFTFGGILFLISELLAKLLYYRKFNSMSSPSTLTSQVIIIKEKYLKIGIIILGLSIIVAYYVMSINTGGGNISSKMEIYKNAMLDNKPLKYRFFISQLYKLLSAYIYIVGYVLIYNIAKCDIKIISMKKHIISIILYCIFSMFSQGARQPTIEIFVFLALVYISLMQTKAEQKKVKKFIIKIIPFTIILAILFYVSMTFVGRRQSERGLLEYITVYFSGGLYAFNENVNYPARNPYWGQSSFADIYSILAKLNIVPESASISYHEFELYGNTVTIFGRWYEDFGAIGVYIMTFLIGFLFARAFYLNIIKKQKINSYHVYRLFYCKFLISIVWAGYDDRIRALFSIQTLILLIIIPLLYKYLIIPPKTI